VFIQELTFLDSSYQPLPIGFQQKALGPINQLIVESQSAVDGDILKVNLMEAVDWVDCDRRTAAPRRRDPKLGTSNRFRKPLFNIISSKHPSAS